MADIFGGVCTNDSQILWSSFPASAQMGMFNLRQRYPVEIQALHK